MNRHWIMTLGGVSFYSLCFITEAVILNHLRTHIVLFFFFYLNGTDISSIFSLQLNLIYLL